MSSQRHCYDYGQRQWSITHSGEKVELLERMDVVAGDTLVLTGSIPKLVLDIYTRLMAQLAGRVLSLLSWTLPAGLLMEAIKAQPAPP